MYSNSFRYVYQWGWLKVRKFKIIKVLFYLIFICIRYLIFDFFFFFVLVNMKKYEKVYGFFERVLDYVKLFGMWNFNIFQIMIYYIFL